ncbi:sugar kinase [Chryseolinea soli]|uniref:Sugar kinase n=1 Tax=Chryseolinea soli TaxID=2321403 RepID=A0A385SJ46_9BACT|nr:sugar kinase [Chryseolinea soli]AYB30922.1 sugar kinase [Chryseolinea soli]
MQIEKAIVIVNKTRLENLIERFNTKAQAKFYIEHAGGDFGDYEREHEIFHASLEAVKKTVQHHFKMKVVERAFITNFLFAKDDLVVVVGQDGLVANAAKYVNGLPMLAINPDEKRYDGVLLPFNTTNYETGLQNVLTGKGRFQEITLAEARTNDGQRLLAFNDLFIGPATHASARYRITHAGRSEQQSSSGIIVSTGAGSTGWLSSVMNMTNGVTAVFGKFAKSNVSLALPWNTDALAYVVREPFQSKHSGISLSGGLIHSGERLSIESYMPSSGVIFSDGIESDYIQFNSGTKVEIATASQKAVLILK